MFVVKTIDPDRACAPQLVDQLRWLAHTLSRQLTAGLRHEKHETIHKARRCLKAIVAVIALLHEPGKRRHVRAMRCTCRAALHHLGSLRDQQIINRLLPTIAGLHAQDITARQRRSTLKIALRLAENLREDVHRLRLRHGRRNARSALVKSREKTRHSAMIALKRPTVVNLHDLRRQAQRLRLQEIILSDIVGMSHAQSESLKCLCADLGEHHDLANAMKHVNHDRMSARSSVVQLQILKLIPRLFGTASTA